MGKVVWYSHLFKNFPQFIVIHTVKGFVIVNEAEVDVLLEFSCFFYHTTDVGSLISGSSAFSRPSLNIWQFSVHIVLKPDLENFQRYFASMWSECYCVVVWTFFAIAPLWGWNENWPYLLVSPHYPPGLQMTPLRCLSSFHLKFRRWGSEQSVTSLVTPQQDVNSKPTCFTLVLLTIASFVWI